MRLSSLLVAIFLTIGCSEDDPTTTPTNDTGVADTGVSDTAEPDTATADGGGDTRDSAASDTAPDAPSDTFDAAVCASFAPECSDMQPCPTDLRCYGGFCAPMEPECGGFVMKMCAGGRSCIRGGGGSIGYCATPEEKTCLCAKRDAGLTLDGCD